MKRVFSMRRLLRLLRSPSPRPASTGNHKFAPSEMLEIVRAGSETAAGAKGSCAGYRCHRGGRAQDGRRRFFQGRKQKLKRTDR